MTTLLDIQRHKATGAWRTLERFAVDIVTDAADRAGSNFAPLLGGGTPLMLALEHRISDDIDQYIRDPQWIGYLSPRLNDRFEDKVTSYDESATSLKLKFPEGEIDFIVSMSLLGLPCERSDDCAFFLEPVAEVLAKKLFYRGWALTPRDLFDWQMIEANYPAELVPISALAQLVAGRAQQIQAALTAMAQSPNARLAWNRIRCAELPDLGDSVRWATRRLDEFRQIASNANPARH